MPNLTKPQIDKIVGAIQALDNDGKYSAFELNLVFNLIVASVKQAGNSIPKETEQGYWVGSGMSVEVEQLLKGPKTDRAIANLLYLFVEQLRAIGVSVSPKLLADVQRLGR